MADILVESHRRQPVVHVFYLVDAQRSLETVQLLSAITDLP